MHNNNSTGSFDITRNDHSPYNEISTISGKMFESATLAYCAGRLRKRKQVNIYFNT